MWFILSMNCFDQKTFVFPIVKNRVIYQIFVIRKCHAKLKITWYHKLKIAEFVKIILNLKKRDMKFVKPLFKNSCLNWKSRDLSNTFWIIKRKQRNCNFHSNMTNQRKIFVFFELFRFVVNDKSMYSHKSSIGKILKLFKRLMNDHMCETQNIIMILKNVDTYTFVCFCHWIYANYYSVKKYCDCSKKIILIEQTDMWIYCSKSSDLFIISMNVFVTAKFANLFFSFEIIYWLRNKYARICWKKTKNCWIIFVQWWEQISINSKTKKMWKN